MVLLGGSHAVNGINVRHVGYARSETARFGFAVSQSRPQKAVLFTRKHLNRFIEGYVVSGDIKLIHDRRHCVVPSHLRSGGLR